MGNAPSILVGKRHGNKLFGIQKYTLVDNIKMNIKEMSSQILHQIQLTVATTKFQPGSPALQRFSKSL
jgi:hypothetical protein